MSCALKHVQEHPLDPGLDRQRISSLLSVQRVVGPDRHDVSVLSRWRWPGWRRTIAEPTVRRGTDIRALWGFALDAVLGRLAIGFSGGERRQRAAPRPASGPRAARPARWSAASPR